jgi:hypothetical protein
VAVGMGALVGGEAGQQRWVARHPALDPAVHLPLPARQRPMGPPQALRVTAAPPRDEAPPPKTGLHPGAAQLDPQRLPQPFMAVPYVNIEGLLSIAAHARFDHGQGSMPRTGPPHAAVGQTVMALRLRAWCPAARRAPEAPLDRGGMVSVQFSHGLEDHGLKRPRPLRRGPEMPCHPTSFLRGVDLQGSPGVKRTAHILTPSDAVRD